MVIYCIECLNTKVPFHRVFDMGNLIGWYCNNCYISEISRKRKIAKNIRMFMRYINGETTLARKEAFRNSSALYVHRYPRYLKANEKRLWIKTLTFNHYSNGNICCVGCKSINNLCLDHINNDGLEERLELYGTNKSVVSGGWHFYSWLYDNGFPDGYQLLCRRCNSKKYHENQYLIIPRRFINKHRKNPKILENYKASLLKLFKDI